MRYRRIAGLVVAAACSVGGPVVARDLPPGHVALGEQLAPPGGGGGHPGTFDRARFDHLLDLMRHTDATVPRIMQLEARVEAPRRQAALPHTGQGTRATEAPGTRPSATTRGKPPSMIAQRPTMTGRRTSEAPLAGGGGGGAPGPKLSIVPVSALTGGNTMAQQTFRELLNDRSEAIARLEGALQASPALGNALTGRDVPLSAVVAAEVLPDDTLRVYVR